MHIKSYFEKKSDIVKRFCHLFYTVQSQPPDEKGLSLTYLPPSQSYYRTVSVHCEQEYSYYVNNTPYHHPPPLL